MKDEIRKILLEMTRLDKYAVEIAATKISRNPRDYEYIVDILEHYMPPFTAKIVAEKIYMMAMNKLNK